MKHWNSIFSTILFFNLTAFSQEESANSSKSPTQFRPGHNLTVLLSAEQSTWHISKNGDSFMGKENDYALGAVVRYGFHINIYKKFGLILGTSSQLMWDSHSYLTFKPGPHVIFPSATVGFVQNFKSDMRVSVLGEYAAAWLPFAKGMSESGNEMELAMIPDTFQFAMQLDKFVAPGRALSILIGMRVMPKSYEYSFEDQKFMNESVFCQAGMTWELGKDLTR